ncbi:MAG: ABC transporter substrate-binding protein [Solirubrobacteraceae bacterium]
MLQTRRISGGRVAMLATILTACAALAGCGGSGATSSASPPAAQTSAPAAGSGASSSASSGAQNGAATGTKLEIAVFSPFTGPNAIYGYFNYNGCVPAVNAINAAGGVLGHPLYCQIVDDRGEPADAVPAAQNMIATSSHLVGLIDGNSGLLSPTVPVLSAAHIPEISLGGDDQFDKSTYPYFWRTTPGDDQAGYALAAYVKFETPYTKIGAIFGNDQAAQGNVPGLVAGAKNLGLQIVSNQAIALDQTSYQTEVTQLLGAHPQVIVTESDPQTAGVLLANLRQAGGLKPLVGTSGTVGNDYDRAATSALGKSTFEKDFVRITQFTATSGPAFDVWKAALLGSKQIKNPSQYETGYGPEVAYDHTTMLALAMLAAKSTDRVTYNPYIAKITQGSTVVHSFAQGKAALAAGKTIDFVGLEGKIAFNKYHNSAGVWSADNPVTNASIKMISAADMSRALGR